MTRLPEPVNASEIFLAAILEELQAQTRQIIALRESLKPIIEPVEQPAIVEIEKPVEKPRGRRR